jgi:outer membrane immunogenic protein
MKRTPVAVFSTLLLAAPAAQAADMALKAPPPPTPVYSWTGFYIGGSIGGAWTRNGQAEGQLFALGTTASPLLPFSTNSSGVIGGPQIGYNYQLARQWVAGIEADFAWTKLNGSQTYNPIPPGVSISAAQPSFLTMGQDVEWLGSVRGRLGYTWDRALLYFTGGAAWSRTNFTGVESRAGGAFGETAAFSSTKTGWVAGGGLEYMLSNYWSGRVQYLHYSFAGTSTIAPGILPTIFDTFSWRRTEVNSLTAGLNYKFGK